MRLRLALALLALVGPAAFAPAPFPRAERRRQSDEITLESFTGRWRVQRMQTSRGSGRHEDYNWATTHIVVANGRWEFRTSDRVGNGFPISVTPAGRESRLNFLLDNDRTRVQGVGLIRRHGPGVQVIYTWGGEDRRPTFQPPHEGGWIITLVKE